MAQRVPLTPDEMSAAASTTQEADAASWKKYLDWKAEFRASRQNYLTDSGLPDAAPAKPTLSETLDNLAFSMTPEDMVDALVQEFEQDVISAADFLKVLDAMLEKKIIDAEWHADLSKLASVAEKVASSAKRTVGILKTTPVVEGDVVDEALVLL